MNKVSLIGRTTKDIELRYTSSQTAVGRFTLAVNRKKKDDGSDFISCVVWGKTAELMEKYIHKGDKVGISGRLQTGSYKKGDVTHYTVDVIVEDFDFLEPKKQESPEDEFQAIEEDLPF